MFFIGYCDKRSDLALFEAYSEYDIKYLLYKFEMGDINKIQFFGRHLAVQLRLNENKPLPDTDYDIVIGSRNRVISLTGASFPGDWVFSSYSRDILRKYDLPEVFSSDSEEEDALSYYSVEDNLLEPEKETEEEILRSLEERQEAVAKKDEEEEQRLESATNFYYSIKKVGYYT